ncbi:UTP--glucose-1-phosphate uridylyltransferase [bacterium]|nr:UTP--glucose-1-phosphate uridylyltransferase [candidate division CSSED10-310 bacterium]
MSSDDSNHVENRCAIIAEKMKKHEIAQAVIDRFLLHYKKLVNGETGMISNTSIKPLCNVTDSEMLKGYEESGRNALARTVMIKLNGGLGTSMGMTGAKSLLEVKKGYSFLDIIIHQILNLRKRYDVKVPVLFMNSTTTRKDTIAVTNRYPELKTDIPVDFLQNRVPKISKKTLLPVRFPDDPALEWCPPGHGDIYNALTSSGILESLVNKGYVYAFVSNADNLGAVLNLQILGYFAQKKHPFMMEVADRTENDRKGGHLAILPEGQLILREIAQCPKDELDDFQDYTKFKYFNTNTIWLNLKTLYQIMQDQNERFNLPIIINSKTVDPQDPESEPVYQIETAMGAAISIIKDASALRVPRGRFLPVKTTQDLLGMWSDVYNLTDDFHLCLHPSRDKSVIINLDPEYYKLINQLTTRFPSGAPSLLNCERLDIQGDIYFGSDIILRGCIRLVNNKDRPAQVPDRTEIVNKTVIF